MALTLGSTLAFSVMALFVHMLGRPQLEGEGTRGEGDSAGAGDSTEAAQARADGSPGSAGIPSFQSATVRFLVQGVCTAATILASRRGKLTDPLTWLGKRENRRLLVTRGLWGAGGMTSYFWALSSIALSDATALVFVNVPLVAVLAAVLLKEPYTLLDAATSVLCMVGVVLVAQPAALFGSDGGAGECRLAGMCSIAQ
jgi:drug/metabolite transporter (DMT)-like permease